MKNKIILPITLCSLITFNAYANDWRLLVEMSSPKTIWLLDTSSILQRDNWAITRLSEKTEVDGKLNIWTVTINCKSKLIRKFYLQKYEDGKLIEEKQIENPKVLHASKSLGSKELYEKVCYPDNKKGIELNSIEQITGMSNYFLILIQEQKK